MGETFIYRDRFSPVIIQSQTATGTAWTNTNRTFANIPTRYVKLGRRGGLYVAFWAYKASGISDCTFRYQLAAWPVDGSVGEKVLYGAAGVSAEPHGWLLADGDVTFGADAKITVNPMSGDTEDGWSPGYTLDDDIGIGVAECDWTQSTEASTNRPAILRVPDAMFFDTFALQFVHASWPEGVTAMAIAYII